MNLKKVYLSDYTSTALVMIRIWLGVVMFRYSTDYLFGGKVPELAAFLESLNWPMPKLMAYSSQIVELVSSFLILLGIRFGAMMLAINMLVAVIFAHDALIFTEAETPFNYFLFALILSLSGMGKFSLDNLLAKR
uniref:DoxX family protein n=2 Tax=Roseivirga sp. TaxID=1964215 RepID=UPI0040471E19